MSRINIILPYIFLFFFFLSFTLLKRHFYFYLKNGSRFIFLSPLFCTGYKKIVNSQDRLEEKPSIWNQGGWKATKIVQKKSQPTALNFMYIYIKK